MGLTIELGGLQLENNFITYNGNVGSAFPNQPLYFGVREYYAGKDHYFKGKIDEVVISGFDV